MSERLMHRFFVDSGWDSVPGEIGRQGIDGLFVKRRDGIISDVLIVESKYNTSKLQGTRAGMQMSDTWVRARVAALHARHPDRREYGQIGRLVDAGRYRGMMWNLEVHDDSAKVTLSQVISRDGTVRLKPMDGSDTVFVLGELGEHLDSGETSRGINHKLLRWLTEELDLAFPGY